MEQYREIYSKFKSLSFFKKSILKFIRPFPNSTYNCFNTKGIKHLTSLRLGLRHLCDHKFKHGFVDSLSPICSCRLDIETTLFTLVITYSIAQNS